MTTHTIL